VKLSRLEVGILVFGAAFLALIAFFFRSGQAPASGGGLAGGGRGSAHVPAGATDGQPTTLLQGFDYTESVGEKPLFRIRSERTIGFGSGAGLPPNWYALEKVSLTIYPEAGAPVTVLADRAQYDDRTKAAVLSGNVRWVESQDGALGETEKLEFDPSKRTLRAPTNLHFTRGTFDVRAASGTYDVRTRKLALLGPIRGSGTGQGSGGLSSIAAESGEYRREEAVIELAGNVSATSAKGDTLACGRLLMKLSPENNRPEWARAFSKVSGTLAPTAPGAAARAYSADEAALFFDPSGDVRSIHLTGNPATVTEPNRQLAARSVDLDIAGGRPVSARANGDVRLRSDRGNAEAMGASASFAPGGDFQTLELEGDVHLEGDGRTGRANRVVDLPDRGVWLLTGTPEKSATVEEDGSRVSASRIEIDRNRKLLRAEGKAGAVFVPAKDRPANGAAFLGDPSRPTYGKADKIVLDQETRLASLSGAASLWQDSSSVFADDITLNDAEKSAAAIGKVRTVLTRAPAAGGAAREEPTVVTARRLLYRESEASAVFEDAVTVTRGAWRATGDRGVAFFAKDRKLERVELSGGVKLADRATGRTGAADRAVDYPNEGRTVLNGSPARVSDAEGNRVAGSTLTITGRGKNVEVTAPEGGRTETIHKTKPN
jgi:lipopolysaccharide export system protein LptA